MAIKYTRGKKELEYSGIDKVTHAFGSTLEKIKSGAMKAAKAPVRAYKKSNARYQKAQAAKELDDVARGFGTVEKYIELNPSYASRAKRLREKAGR